MNAKHQSCRNKFGVPDPCFVYITALSVYPSFNSLRNFFGPQLGFYSFAFAVRTMFSISAHNVSAFGSLQSPFFFFFPP